MLLIGAPSRSSVGPAQERCANAPRICCKPLRKPGRDTFFRVGLGLSAPAAVSVEIRSPERRVFRLSREIGEGGLRLAHPAPFEIGRPVKVYFALPATGDSDGDAMALDAWVELTGDPEENDGTAGGCQLMFRDASFATRETLKNYILPRLRIPGA